MTTTAMTTPTDPTTGPAAYADVVDLDRYPIHDLDSDAGYGLVEECRAQLVAQGACALEGFIRPGAVAEMARLALSLEEVAWSSNQSHTVYFTEPDASHGADHPLARTVRSAKHGIAYDHIPAEAPVRRLYESDDLTRFIAAVLEKPVLHRSADPLDAMQMTLFHEGDELGWHFDNSEFSVTVMYQPANAGGDFLYAPGLRSQDDENYAGVQRVLDGADTDRLRVLPSAPGTLAFFRGQHALHWVTPIQGPTPRINTVLTYGERPDMRLSDLTSQLFYGRTSPRD